MVVAPCLTLWQWSPTLTGLCDWTISVHQEILQSAVFLNEKLDLRFHFACWPFSKVLSQVFCQECLFGSVWVCLGLFGYLSHSLVCLSSVSWHTCSIESSALPIPVSIPLCHSQLHGVGCGDFWWQWRMLWPAPLHLCISPKHLKMAALYGSNLCFEADPFCSSHMKLWTSACRALYPAQFEQSSRWFIYRAVWLLHSHMKLLWSLHMICEHHTTMHHFTTVVSSLN